MMRLEEHLRKIVGEPWVISGKERKLYAYDGFTAVEGDPELVVLPGNEEEAVKVIRLLLERGVKFIVRGSGTSLSGATVPVGGEVIVGLSRLNRVHSLEGYEMEVGPGIANVMVTKKRSSPPLLRSGSLQLRGLLHRREHFPRLRRSSRGEVRYYVQ